MKKHNRVKNIEIIERDAPFRFERVEANRERYKSQRGRWWRDHRISLPSFRDLRAFGPRQELRIVASPVTITVTFGDTSWTQWRFNEGFITDLASVPKAVRSVIDNDDYLIISAALVHDYNFTTHHFGDGRQGFRATNKLFYRMLRAAGYPRIKSVLAYLAVNSIVGRALYENKTPERDPWTRQTTKTMSSR